MLKNLLRPKEQVFIALQVLAIMTFVFALFSERSFTSWAFGILGYTAIFGLGITVTFHRLLAHRSYRLWKPLEYLFSLFANIGCTGSSVGWVFVHRAHHLHTDREGDPHSPVVYGPLGAMIGQYGSGFDKFMVRDIINDPFHRFMHDYHHAIIIGYPILMALLGPQFFIFGWAVPVALNTIVSRGSNWIDHEPRFGTKSFETTDEAHNVWWWSIPSFGEGWHNNHHAFPGSYSFGHGYQYDPGKWFIRGLMKIGLATESAGGVDWRRS